jgi:hypothetical protein
MSRNEKLAALSNKIPEKLTKGEMVTYQDKIKERDNTLVTGVFRNLEEPGAPIKFPFRVHKGPINIYTLSDGVIYTIPYALGHHLEHKCHKIGYKRGKTIVGGSMGSMSSDGIAAGANTQGMEGDVMTEEHYIPRFSFLSSDVPQRTNIFMRR